MKEKINIAELLKDCPGGMELDCAICENVYFDKVDFDSGLIKCFIKNDVYENIYFYRDGTHISAQNAKCVIFPKGKTTWEGFQRPFKDGDIVFSGVDLISIYKEQIRGIGGKFVRLHSYVSLRNSCMLEIDKDIWTLEGIRFATEEEKQKLFDAIKDNGYKWNPENKTLEKLIQPKFKDGDVIYNAGIKAVAIFNKQTDMNTISHCFLNILGNLMICHYHSKDLSDWRLATENEKQELFDAIKAHGYKWNSESKTLEKLVEPRFKVGDKIRHKINNKNDIYEISKVYDDSYGIVGFTWMIYMKYQDNYELVPKKFDITTLKPFESKVLVRDANGDNWIGAFYSHYKSELFYVIGNVYYYQCIPYEGNEHLLGTNNDCDEFYKNW